MVLEKPTIEGESPVFKKFFTLIMYLSTTLHVKFRGNLGGPPSKAKY